MELISRCIAKKYFREDLLKAQDGYFKVFDNIFEKEAIFLVNKDMIISYVPHESYNNSVFLVSLSKKGVDFSIVANLFKETGVDTFLYFINKRLMNVVLKRYKDITIKFKEDTLILYFR